MIYGKRNAEQETQMQASSVRRSGANKRVRTCQTKPSICIVKSTATRALFATQGRSHSHSQNSSSMIKCICAQLPGDDAYNHKYKKFCMLSLYF